MVRTASISLLSFAAVSLVLLGGGTAKAKSVVYYNTPAQPVSYYYAPPAVSYYAPPAVSYYTPAVSYSARSPTRRLRLSPITTRRLRSAITRRPCRTTTRHLTTLHRAP